MILIDQPYVSDFLKNTITANRFPVVRTREALSMFGPDELPYISEKEAIETIKSGSPPVLYTNSENSIAWIERNLAFTDLTDKVRLFKDKNAFRDLMKPVFPDIFYRKIHFRDLAGFDTSSMPFPSIIKPATGFFSLGVHRIGSRDSWTGVVEKIISEAGTIRSLYPEEVLDTAYFIVEQYIGGEEYAIDCYFDNEGKPVILNILHHLFSSENDVSDRVYITSATIVESHLQRMSAFLAKMGNLAGLQNFPAHVEVRIDRNAQVVPVEVNPMRFGGWCTTADLAWHAWGFNAYEYFQEGKTPDWESLLRANRNDLYSVVVLDNSTGIEGRHIRSFDYGKLEKSFASPLEVRPVDFRKWPLFGFVFCKTPSGNMNDLYRILKSDLREFTRI